MAVAGGACVAAYPAAWLGSADGNVVPALEFGPELAVDDAVKMTRLDDEASTLAAMDESTLCEVEGAEAAGGLAELHAPRASMLIAKASDITAWSGLNLLVMELPFSG